MGELMNKIYLHRAAYESINEDVPPFKVTIQEWNNEFLEMKKNGFLNDESELLGIDLFYGVEIELVVIIERTFKNG